MKKTLINISTIIFCFSIISCASKTENNACDNMTSKNVCVLIINQSGHDIRNLILKHEDGSKNIGALTKDSQTTMMFESAGENSYILTAILDNGDTLKSLGNYTEGGYKTTETITQDSIKTRYDIGY